MRKITTLITGLGIFALATSAQAIVVSPETDANVLANVLGGSSDISISNAQFSGGYAAAGIFSDGLSSGIGFDSGVILSSGNVKSVAGANTSSNTSTAYWNSGSSNLSNLSGFNTYDAAILDFDFEFNGGLGGDLSFDVVFGSEEYNEWVGSSFNDVFAVFLDGVNIATLDDGSAVSINTINNGSNSSLYVDNHASSYNTQMDGFTQVLSWDLFGLSAGSHSLSFQIADSSDHIYDSWAMIDMKGSSVHSVPELSASLAPVSLMLLAGLMALGIERRRKQS